MAFASTAFGQLRYIAEATPGVTPVSGNGVNLRTTGPTMNASMSSISSNEIRAERMTLSSTLVDLTVDGGFDFELSGKEYDPFLAGVLGGTWTHYGTNGVGTSFQMTSTATTITAGTAPTGTSAFTTLAGGDWFKLVPGAGATQAVKDYFNDKWFKVSSITAPTSTAITLDPATPLSGAGLIAVAAPFSISTSKVANGNGKSSFTLEWAQTDITQFTQYRGMRPNTMSLDFSVGSIVTGSMGFFGQTHGITQVTALPGAPVASQSGDVMNSVTDMGALIVNGTNLLAGGTSFVQSVSLEINNNLRGQKALGVFGNAGVGYGELAITGTMECYFENETLYQLALNSNTANFTIGVADSAGQGYLIELPKIKFTDASLNYGSKDSDVMLSLPFQAFYDTNLNRGIRVFRAAV